MSKCVSQHGEYSEHQVTDGVCDYCGVVDEDALITGLREIQELHKPMVTQVVTGDCAVGECDHEDDCPTVHFEYCAACNEIAEHANAYYAEEGMQIVSHPCATRQLADKALGGAS